MESPFATPRSNVLPEVAVVSTGAPAPRPARLLAAALDGIIAFYVLIPPLHTGLTGELPRAGQVAVLWWMGDDPLSVTCIALWAGLVAFQAYLVTRTGRSIGKLIVRVQILRLDGNLPGLIHGALLRRWLLAAITIVPIIVDTALPRNSRQLWAAGELALFPFIGAAIALAVLLLDALMIFGRTRRCLHDRIAGTQVIKT